MMGEFKGPGQWLHETNLARRRYALAHPEIIPDEDDEKASVAAEFKYRPGQPRDEHGRFAEEGQMLLPGTDTITASPRDPDEIADVEGRVIQHGRREPMDSAALQTNPQRWRNNPLAEMNCQYCVGAYEMRRRGYDVQAISAMATRPSQFTEWFEKDGRPISPEMPFLSGWAGQWDGEKAYKRVSGHIRDTYPEGARGALSYANSDYSGHVVSWERVSGLGVTIVDSQAGKIVGPLDSVARGMAVKPWSITLYRLDDADLTDRAGEAVLAR